LPKAAAQQWAQYGVEPGTILLLGGRFLDQFQSLCSTIRKALGREHAKYSGCKEIVCEEYVPYFLRNGIRVIQLIRDPRDVVCSCNFGTGKAFVGEIRPTLYTLRAWRKSVAFAMQSQGEHGFRWLRFEDLVSKPQSTLDEIWKFLDIERLNRNVIEGPLLNQDGSIWTGNSSFKEGGEITAEPVGRFRELLDAATIEYIEGCCSPELIWCSYSVQQSEFRDSTILCFREPFLVNHERFERDYSSAPARAAAEIARHRLLFQDHRQKLDLAEIRAWFISEGAYNELRRVVTTINSATNGVV